MTPPLRSVPSAEGVRFLRSKETEPMLCKKSGQLELETAEGTCAFGTAVPSLQGWNRNSGGAGSQGAPHGGNEPVNLLLGTGFRDADQPALGQSRIPSFQRESPEEPFL